MRFYSIGVLAAGLLAASLPAATGPYEASVASGIKWLIATQGSDGGWGQDGGNTSSIRQLPQQHQRLETN